MPGAGENFGHMLSDAIDEEEPVRLRRAEKVLQGRIGNVTLVLEKCSNEFNAQAVLRTAEAMGVQNVYLVRPTLPKRPANQQKKRRGQEFEWGEGIGVTSGCERWLSLKYFTTTSECIEALKQEGHTIWSTDLSAGAVCLDSDFDLNYDNKIPTKIALVMGSEAEGVSPEMLEASALRIYLPMFGFTDSFNVGVASALAIYKVIDIVGRSQLPDDRMKELRTKWMKLLSGNPTITAVISKYLKEERVPEPLDDLRLGRANCDGPRIIKKVRRRQEEALIEQQKEASQSFAFPTIPKSTISVVVCGVAAGYLLGRYQK